MGFKRGSKHKNEVFHKLKNVKNIIKNEVLSE